MLQIKEICKKYKTGNLIQKALDSVSLNLRDNEFVAILGPSGSGKTTLLNIIGGLDRYDSGDLIINGISTKKYKDKDWDSYRNHTIGFVFQSYNLIPHQTILSNVELALTISGISKSERREKAKHALDQVGLNGQYHKKPSQLSGGQMQRVAIARALVNNPHILLADEPTGALDSDTSLQVMDLLKEVAKDRLVVMVTHNPELAQDYATRIVNLKDGKIISDSDPLILDESHLEEPSHQNMGKTSMSWFTSLALSFNNLKTKKGRTLLTSFAGSIGIIGIALILSLSNGVNTYIKEIEEDTLSEYPLQIQSTGFDITSMMIDTSTSSKHDEDEVGTIEMVTNMFSKIGSNDLASLKSYLEGPESHISQYTNTIEYTYNVVPQIFMSDTTKIRQVNPDTSMSALGISSTNSSNSLMSKMMSTNVFFALPNDERLYNEQYDIKAGHWPTNYNESILILSPKGNINDFLLYTLGLRNPEDLDQMVNDFAAEKVVEVPSYDEHFTYDDILGITFKMVNASDFYVYDEEYQLYRDKKDDTAYMRNLIKKGEDLKIVGIAQAKEGTTAAMLTSGIYYPASLTNHVIEQAQNSEIVKAQLKTPEKNVFTGKRFDDKNSNDFNMASLFSINEELLQSAFGIDTSALSFDLDGLDEAFSQISLPPLDLSAILSQLDLTVSQESMQTLINDLIVGYTAYMQAHPETSIDVLQEQMATYLQSPEVSQKLQAGIEEILKDNQEPTIKFEQLNALLIEIMAGYEDYANANDYLLPSQIYENFYNFLQSEEAKAILAKDLKELIQASNLEDQITVIMQDYMAEAMDTISSNMQEILVANMTDLSASIANAFYFDADVFAQAIEMNMTEEDLAELMASMMSKDYASYDNNLRQLNYANLDKPASISIYPKDFESKTFEMNTIKQWKQAVRRTKSLLIRILSVL